MQDQTASINRVFTRWPLLRPLGIRNYLLLWIGSVISYVGANLTFIAFPWLILKISGDPLAVGGVMAIAGIPRAALMLVGGAATDRFSPRTVLLISTFLRLLLMLLMATLTWFEVVTLWQVFVLAFLFGSIDAFFGLPQAPFCQACSKQSYCLLATRYCRVLHRPALCSVRCLPG